MSIGFPGVERVAKVIVNAVRIRQLREVRSWTQERLAEVARLGVRTMQRIEKTGVAGFDSVQRIAQALGVEASVDRFTGFRQRKESPQDETAGS
jgi:transcriptional regulator with XRE-family HTH domain